MKDFDAAGMIAGRREDDADLCAQNRQLAISNSRLRIALGGLGVLMVGFVLGGLGQSSTDPIVAYTATDKSMYRIYESGRIQYLRIEGNPPHTDKGLFGWGEVQIDERFTLQKRP